MDQVRLLVDILPAVAVEEDFALKGGTAVNLFYRDLPRLSVDVDLTFLPVRNREQSLADIDDVMNRIGAAGSKVQGVTSARIAGGGGGATRVLFQRGAATVKVETSPVTRGVVFDPGIKRVSPAVEDEFGFTETRLVAFEDLFAGKLHAALDRQHPRDLFDVKLLYENEGITDDLFRAFLVHVASSNRPPHELLNPNLSPLPSRPDVDPALLAINSPTVQRCLWRPLPESMIRHEGDAEPGNLRVLRARGDSMEPLVSDGDRLLVAVTRRAPATGEMAVLWDGTGLVVKRVEVLPNAEPPRLRLISTNPTYELYTCLAQDAHIVGKVLWT